MNTVSLPRETHTGTLRIGSLELPCAILDNNMRVISSTGFNEAFGQDKRGLVAVENNGVAELPRFLARESLKPFISADFSECLKLISYQPRQGGREAKGFRADALVASCEAILAANAAGALRTTQQPLVQAATAILPALAKVGITALVDEACGYLPQPDAYRNVLEASVQETLTRSIAQDRTDRIMFERRITQEVGELRQLVQGRPARAPRQPASSTSSDTDLPERIMQALDPVSQGIFGRDLRRMLGATYAPFYQALFALRSEYKVIGLNPDRTIEAQLYVSARYADAHKDKHWLNTKTIAALLQVSVNVFNNWVNQEKGLRDIANKEGNVLLWPTEQTLAYWKEHIVDRLRAPRSSALYDAVVTYVEGKDEFTTEEVRQAVAPGGDPHGMLIKISYVLHKLDFEKCQRGARVERSQPHSRYWKRRPMN